MLFYNFFCFFYFPCSRILEGTQFDCLLNISISFQSFYLTVPPCCLSRNNQTSPFPYIIILSIWTYNILLFVACYLSIIFIYVVLPLNYIGLAEQCRCQQTALCYGSFGYNFETRIRKTFLQRLRN